MNNQSIHIGNPKVGDTISQGETIAESNQSNASRSVMAELNTTQPEGVSNTEMVASWVARYYSECTGKEAGVLTGALDAGGKRIIYLDLGMLIAPIVCFPVGMLVAYAIKKYYSGGMA